MVLDPPSRRLGILCGVLVLLIVFLFATTMAQQNSKENVDGQGQSHILTPAEKRAKKLREIQERHEAQQQKLDEGPTMALPGRKFNMDWAGGEFTIQGSPLFIQQKENSGLGTGLTIWDGAILLAKYMEHQYFSVLSGKKVLELGAGTGVTGLAVAALGAGYTYLSDLDYALDNLEVNIEKNRHILKGEITSMELDWNKPFSIPDLDIIVAADVVWVEELVRPLVNTLITLTNEAIEIASDGYSEDTDDLEAKSFPSVTGVKGVGPLVVISHQTRSHASDKLLFHLLEEYFNVNKVPESEHPPSYRDEDLKIFELKRKVRP